MHKMIKQSTVLFIIMALIFISSTAPVLAQDTSKDLNERSGEKMAFDLVILRPVGFVGTAAGTVVFVLSLPFSLLGKNHQEAFENMVKEPARYTFTRPLGDF